jgi:4-hydroxybenzoate polyprenyltransferase
MQFDFNYDKKKTLQALRYHFISRNEIRVMLVLVNVFAIVSAVLFYTKKIRPEPFLLGSTIWLFMVIAVWFILPYSIYRKASTFKDHFSISFSESGVFLRNERGSISWQWNQFHRFFETPHFFHLYFDSKSFFLVPKENITDEMRHELRALLNNHIPKK